jgi:uncharacterized protein
MEERCLRLSAGEIEFEWDQAKAASNLAKHGVSFMTAVAIFANEVVENIDDREDYGEDRFIALGRVELEVYRVVYSWRGSATVRIISVKRASRHEREIYYGETHA